MNTKAPINWLQLTDTIVPIKQLLPLVDQRYDSSVLFDQRLEAVIKGYRDQFDLVLISHIPLTQWSDQLSQEQSELRCWVNGEGVYQEHGNPSCGMMKDVLHGYISIIKKIHNDGESLLFHPYFFHPHINAQMPSSLICQSIVNRRSTNLGKKQFSALDEEIYSSIFHAEHGYHRARTMSVFETRDLLRIWSDINKRINSTHPTKDISFQDLEPLKQDIAILAKKHHQIIHDFLVSKLFADSTRRTSAYLAGPTSLLSPQNSKFEVQIAKGIVGMFWVILFSKKEKWGKAEQTGLVNLLRTIWLLVISDHHQKKYESSINLGIEKWINAMSHELAKQTGVLFGNRLKKLSDLFEINHLPRTNKSTGVLDWPIPVGKIVANEAIENVVASWLISPVPELFDNIRDYLVIWAGLRDGLELLGISEDSSLQHFLETAKRVAINGHLAEKMKSYSPSSLEKCISFKAMYRMELEGLPSIVTKVHGQPIFLATQRLDNSDNSKSIMSRIFRAISAAISNAIKHSLSTKNIRFTALVNPKKNRITFIVINSFIDINNNKNYSFNDGSRGVIMSCLNSIGNEHHRFEFRPINGKKIWITKFNCPFETVYKGENIDLFKLGY